MKKKNNRLNLRIPDDQMERLNKAAEVLDTTISDFARRLFDKEMDRLAKRYPELARKAA